MPTSISRIASPIAIAVAISGLVLSGCSHSAPVVAASPPPAPIRASYASGQEVLAAMRARYVGKWYSTITFKQETSRLQPDGKWNVQTWYEAGHFPGRLRIDFDPLSAGNGVLYARDSVWAARGGKAPAGSPGINDLLLLGFDVYFNTPDRMATLLRNAGFALDHVHADSLDGRPMIVVGARAGELKRKQFWVDAERLYFLRLLEVTQRDSTKLQDVRFINYRPEGAAWVSPRVEIHVDGKLTFHEDYTEIRTNVPLDENLFDASRWKTAHHWRTP